SPTTAARRTRGPAGACVRSAGGGQQGLLPDVGPPEVVPVVLEADLELVVAEVVRCGRDPLAELVLEALGRVAVAADALDQLPVLRGRRVGRLGNPRQPEHGAVAVGGVVRQNPRAVRSRGLAYVLGVVPREVA